MLVEYIRDGASNFSRRQMGSYLSSSRRNSSWMFHSSGLSIHGVGLGKNRAQSTLWVISGRLGVGLGHPRDRVELGCASAISRWVPETSSLWQKGLEIIRARLGARGRQNQTFGWSQAGNKKGPNHTEDIRLKQLWHIWQIAVDPAARALPLVTFQRHWATPSMAAGGLEGQSVPTAQSNPTWPFRTSLTFFQGLGLLNSQSISHTLSWMSKPYENPLLVLVL